MINIRMEFIFLKMLISVLVINIISPIGNTNQRMGVHGPLNILEVGSGALEE